MVPTELTKIAVFDGQQIRRIFYENEWWFSVIDIIAFLTDSKKPRDYWHKMKIREKDTSDIELSTICRQLKLTAPVTLPHQPLYLQWIFLKTLKVHQRFIRIPAGADNW
jgi:hypothetical protein